MQKVLIMTLLVTILSAKQLMFIQQTFRHGARFPIYPQKADQSDIGLKMNSVGELTNQGKHMHYLLGKIIYEQYWQLLFGGTQYLNKYDQSQFYFKSTDYNRTIESAQSHLFGLFQKLPKLQLNKTNYEYSLPAWESFKASQNISQVFQIFQTGPAFHPTAIHVQKPFGNSCSEGDFLTKYDIENCPNQKFWGSQNIASDYNAVIMRDSRVKQAIDALSEQVGAPVQFQDVYKWKSNDVCLKYLGYPRLKVFDNPKYAKIFEFLEVYVPNLIYFSQPDQIRTVASNYIKQTLSNLIGKVQDTYSPRIVIYSAHDTTLGMVMAALNLANTECITDHYLNGVKNDDTCIWEYPPFTANLIFELWNNNGEYTIKLIYNGQSRKIPICDYKLQCTLTEFKEWANNFIVKDVNSACGFVKDEKVYYAIIFLILSAIILLVIYVIFLHAKIKKIDTIAIAKKQGYIVNFEEKLPQEMKT